MGGRSASANWPDVSCTQPVASTVVVKFNVIPVMPPTYASEKGLALYGFPPPDFIVAGTAHLPSFPIFRIWLTSQPAACSSLASISADTLFPACF